MDKVQNFIFPNAGAASDDGVSWWMKYAGKAAGIIGGIGEPWTKIICAYTVCPGSSDSFYIVTYYIKWVTTSCARNFW